MAVMARKASEEHLLVSRHIRSPQAMRTLFTGWNHVGDGVTPESGEVSWEGLWGIVAWLGRGGWFTDHISARRFP